MVEIADGLDELRALRNQCDYNDVVPDLLSIVSDALLESAAVIQQL